MGLGIAQVCGLAGHSVLLFDLQEEAIDRAVSIISKNLEKGISLGKLTNEAKANCLLNIHKTLNISDVKADLIIEAVVERLDVKLDIFSKLAEVNDQNCILATNTSSIPITQIAAALPNPSHLVGIHFFNPAHIMKLVEVIEGAHTSKEVVQKSVDFINGLGKTPIVAKDSPGFIVNRVARHFYVESLQILEEGVASHEVIDDLVRASGFKMGPFQLMDLIGVETNFSVTESMYNLFYQNAKFRPSRIQKQKVDAGHHGRKTKRGFYAYE